MNPRDGWERVTPGHYLHDSGAEVIRSGARRWLLSSTFAEETAYRSLREAQEAVYYGRQR